MLDVVIIDPASTEFNRGSFCYLPYLTYSGMKRCSDMEIDIWENFTVSDIDNLPPANKYLVSLWSYPQLDACFVLDRFLDNVQFFGYYPLIEEYDLPVCKIPEETIMLGMINYPSIYPLLDYLLLSDCDMHLKKYSGKVYPLFTSYGCPKGCAFCPSTVNQKERLVVPQNEVLNMLIKCKNRGVTNIHFTDEDFFFKIDNAHQILKMASELGGFKFICMGEVQHVLRYIEKYGQDTLHSSGMKLIEVGFETGDEELGKEMGKSPVSKCIELANKCEIDIFWLTLTFFPGETLKTLNTTGKFLQVYGYKLDELYGRIATNSTHGGLGQFFQAYPGTKNYTNLKNKGISVSDRPIRLIPSFIPFSFLHCKIEQRREITKEDHKWFNLYKIKQIPKIKEGKTIYETIPKGELPIPKMAIFYAICGRLGII